MGIKVTILYPGPVRTDFLSRGSLVIAEHKIDDHTQAQVSLDLHLGSLAGNQAGDPDKLAMLIMQSVDVPHPLCICLPAILPMNWHCRKCRMCEKILMFGRGRLRRLILSISRARAPRR